jgi:hypothetical protein
MAAPPHIARENGKKGGRPKGSKGTHTLEAEAIKSLYIDLAREHARPVAMSILREALAGDIAAAREFNDRAFGRAPQSIEMKGTIEVTPSKEIIALAQKLNGI